MQFTLAERKKGIYAAVVIAFLTLCSAYIWRTLAAADESAGALMREWGATTRESLNKDLSLDTKKLQLFLLDALSGVSNNGELSENERKTLSRLLAAGYPGQTFFYMAEDGMVYDSHGVQRGKFIDPSVKEKSRSGGVAVTAFLDLASGRRVKQFAQIVPLPDAGSGYVIRVRKNNEFARTSLVNLSVAGDYLALFDAGGEVISSVVKFESGEDETMQEELRMGAAGFLQSGQNQSFTRRGWQLGFNNYLLLDKDEGLVLGARIPAAQLLPFFGDMMLFSVVVFVIIFSLIILVIVLDIINDKEKARELHKISFLDFLTGLLNELGMQAALKDFLGKGLADNNSLVCFDLVNFRRFNAMFGYAAGDKALRAIAGVLRARYSYGVRISSDVFACLTRTSPKIIEELNQRLHAALQEEIGDGHIDSLSFKYGVYPMHGPKHTIGEVYDGALLALKNAKKMPKRLGYVYDDELQKQAKLHRKIELFMLHALSKDEFQLYIQPKYDIVEKRCCGGEVLVRWHSDDIGLVMPNDFIPLFERNGFIVELDFYMLSTMFRNLREAIDRGGEPAPLSINQSRMTIAFPNYMARVKNIIKQFDVPTRYIELEITEGFLEHDYQTLVPLMYQLKELGFSIAMDDFGSGYSSLNTLRELPVDILKIDKAFLDESDDSARSRTIIRNVINMSRELGINVVCEGVETEQQVRFLEEAGCNVIQGYYYSKPVPYREYIEKFF